MHKLPDDVNAHVLQRLETLLNREGQLLTEDAEDYLTQILKEKDDLWRQHEQDMYEAVDAEYQLQLKRTTEYERWRAKGIVANYLVVNDKGEKNDPGAGKNDVLLEAIKDIDDDTVYPIDEDGNYIKTPRSKNGN